MSREDQAKRDLCEKLLDLGMVMAVVDARREGVRVPPHLTGDPKVRLNLSYRFETPVEVDAWGARAALSFSGVSFDCALPWSAIYVLFSHVSGQPYVFPDDVPSEVVDEIGVETLGEEVPQPALHVVSSKEATETEEDPSPPLEPSPPGQRRAHLRLVK